MPLYRKKPVVIAAERFIAAPWDEQEQIANWCHGKLRGTQLNSSARIIQIDTLEGEMTAQVGDYIIRGVQGEFYPCKPDIFEATYDEVEAEV